jgi:hypothetical protein
MRNNTIFILLTVLALATTSCRKETTTNNDGAFNELLKQSMKTIRMIESFELQLNGNLKTGQLIEVDSAVWYAEALQNYAYAHPEIAFEDFVRTKTAYTLTIDQNQMATMTAFEAMYDQMEADLLAELEQIPSEEKNLRFADVRLDSLLGSTAYISVVRAFGFKFIYGAYLPFEEDDDWYWGTLGQEEFNNPPLGKCDNTMQGVSDGSDELERRLNNPMIEFEQPFRFIPTSIGDPIEFHGLDEFAGRLYAGWNYDEINCLTNDTLTFYLGESHDILHNSTNGIRPLGKHLYDVQIKDYLMFLPNNQGQFYHHYFATYGILTLVPIIND